MNIADIVILTLIGLILFAIVFHKIKKIRRAKTAGVAPSCCSGNCSGCALSGKK